MVKLEVLEESAICMEHTNFIINAFEKLKKDILALAENLELIITLEDKKDFLVIFIPSQQNINSKLKSLVAEFRNKLKSLVAEFCDTRSIDIGIIINDDMFILRKMKNVHNNKYWNEEKCSF